MTNQVTCLEASSTLNMLKYTTPNLRKIWDTKMANDEKSTFKKTENGIKLILDDPSYVMFESLDYMKTFTEYVQCDITDIKKTIMKEK